MLEILIIWEPKIHIWQHPEHRGFLNDLCPQQKDKQAKGLKGLTLRAKSNSGRILTTIKRYYKLQHSGTKL